MEIYLVGGAVRDKLLGHPVQEKDWVVVGATPEEMLAKGFKPVGKEFPVFLHPQTKEEYALARTERKVGKGYKGFTFYAAPDVTLTEDLQRRDLTINAMAETPEGKLIDPYDGQTDLKNKVLRHVSAAFQEDPVRILRLARFSAKFPDFSIHPETIQLMKNMVNAGEVNALVTERVWQELSRGLANEKPIRFFEALAQCDALPILFPEISMSGQGISLLDQTNVLTPTARFAVLLHDIPEKDLQSLLTRNRVPNEFADLALLVNRHHEFYHQSLSANAETILKFLLTIDALRRPQRFEDFLMACQIIHPDITTDQQQKIKNALQIIKTIDTKSLQEKNLVGESFAKELEKLRLSALQKIIE